MTEGKGRERMDKRSKNELTATNTVIYPKIDTQSLFYVNLVLEETRLKFVLHVLLDSIRNVFEWIIYLSMTDFAPVQAFWNKTRTTRATLLDWVLNGFVKNTGYIQITSIGITKALVAHNVRIRTFFASFGSPIVSMNTYSQKPLLFVAWRATIKPVKVQRFARKIEGV